MTSYWETYKGNTFSARYCQVLASIDELVVVVGALHCSCCLDFYRTYMLGAGSDFTPFYSTLGIPAIDFRYTFNEVRVVYQNLQISLHYAEKIFDEFPFMISVNFPLYCEPVSLIFMEFLIKKEPSH